MRLLAGLRQDGSKAALDRNCITVASVTPLNEFRFIVGPPDQHASGERHVIRESLNSAGNLISRQ
jgi:hypothetical protein